MIAVNVLFLCRGNSARSIIAESLMNHWGKGHFVGHSGGNFPETAVHPLALEALNERLLPTEGLHSKDWDEFAAPGAPEMEYIFTVGDAPADEVHPAWPGQPVTAHWAVPDPAAVTGTRHARMAAFRTACRTLEGQIRLFLR
jgi:arsenate reductase